MAQVALRDVAQHPRHDLPALERLQVRAHRQLGAGAAGDVAEGLGAQAARVRVRFELARQRRGSCGRLPGESLRVDLELEVREHLRLLQRLALRGGCDLGHVGRPYRMIP